MSCIAVQMTARPSRMVGRIASLTIWCDDGVWECRIGTSDTTNLGVLEENW